jgi:hypothetical protein
MHVRRAPTLAIHLRVTNPSDDPVVIAYLRVGQHVEQRILSTTATKGDVFDTDWGVAASATVTPGTDVVGLDAPLRTVVVGAGWGATSASASKLKQILQRFSYRIEGTNVEMITPGRMFTEIDRGTSSERQVSTPAVALG